MVRKISQYVYQIFKKEALNSSESLILKRFDKCFYLLKGFLLKVGLMTTM